MRLPIKLSACFAFCTLGSLAFGQVTFTDDFDRAEIGPDWTTTGGTSWAIVDGTLHGGGGTETTQDHFIYHDGLALTGSWTMVANVEFLAYNQNWQGFGLNVQDDAGTTRSYINRFRTQESFGNPAPAGHHFLEGEGAGPGSLSFPNTNTGSPQPTLGIDTLYTFTYEWDEGTPEQITVAITEGESSVFGHTFSLSGWTDLTGGGFAGFYDARSMAVHDVSITVVPEPRTTAAVVATAALFVAMWVRRRRTGRS